MATNGDMTRYELYKAVKWQIIHYSEDCGMNLPQLWEVVNGRRPKGLVFDEDIKKVGAFWRNTVIEDYIGGNMFLKRLHKEVWL